LPSIDRPKPLTRRYAPTSPNGRGEAKRSMPLAPYFSTTLNGGSPLLAGTVSSAIARIIAVIT
jgi:hypothetical protein